jgi:hypothetical protein
MHTERPTERLARLRRERQERDAIEVDSWIAVLTAQRVNTCPSGRLHRLRDLCPPTKGYYFRCLDCGHLIDLPFA